MATTGRGQLLQSAWLLRLEQRNRRSISMLLRQNINWADTDDTEALVWGDWFWPAGARAVVTQVYMRIPAASGPSTQTITPTGLPTRQFIGTQSINPGAVTIGLAGLPQRAGFGTATMGNVIAPTGLPPRGIVGTDVISVGAVTITPTGLPPRPAMGTQSVSSGAANVATEGLPPRRAIGTDTVTPGAVSITPTGLPPRRDVVGTQSVAGAAASITPTGLPPRGLVSITRNKHDGQTLSSSRDVTIGAGYTDVSPKQLVRTKANRLYICLVNCESYPGDGISNHVMMYKGNQDGIPTSYTEQNSASRPSGGIAQWGCAIDQNDIIHVVYNTRASAGGNITDTRYITYNTWTDTWGTSESIDNTVNFSEGGGNQGHQSIAIALDAKGFPHVVYLKTDGTRARCTYSQRISGTWTSGVTVDTQSFGSNEQIWHPNIAFDTAGRIIVAWLKGTFNDTADGTIYCRVKEAGTAGAWRTSVQISATAGALTSIDQSTSLLVTADNRYHITYINASTTPGNKYIRYRYSDDLGDTWSANDPASGTQATHNPVLGDGANGTIRIYAHGTPDGSNVGENLYYFEGSGGSSTWGSWTLILSGVEWECSVNTRWAMYHHSNMNYLDIAFWDFNYPNIAHVGVEYLGGGLVITPVGLDPRRAMGTQALTPGAVAVTTTGLPPRRGIGTQLMSNIISPTGLPQRTAFGLDTVTPGAVTLTLTGLPPRGIVGADVLSSLYTMALTGLPPRNGFGTQTITVGAVTISTSGLPPRSAFGTQVITTGAVTLSLAGLPPRSAFGTQAVTVGVQFIQPEGLPSRGIVGTDVISTGAVNIALAGLEPRGAFGTQAVSTGAITLALTGLPPRRGIGTETVTPGAVNITLAGLEPRRAMGEDVVTPGAVSIVLTGLAPRQAIGTDTVTLSGLTITTEGLPPRGAVGTQTVALVFVPGVFVMSRRDWQALGEELYKPHGKRIRQGSGKGRYKP